MVSKTTLKNGLKLITIPYPKMESVALLVLVGVGSKYEEKKTNGLSHFLEHMFGEGTKKRPNWQKLFAVIDEVGGKYDFATSKEYSLYWAKVHFRHLNLAIGWLSDVLINPLFRKKEIEKERKIILEEINMYLDDPASYVWTLWEKLLYGNQPAGFPILGTKENVLSFQRKDIVRYWKNHYLTGNTILVLAGRFDERNIISKMSRAFAHYNQGKSKPMPKVLESQEKPALLLYPKKTNQVHFCLGVRGFPLSHPLRYAQDLLSLVLGGMATSRLLKLVRGEKGLVYSIYTVSQTYTNNGHLVTASAVSGEKVEEVLTIILKEYRKVKRYGISKRELRKAKDYWRGRLSLNLETSDAKASFYGLGELLEGKLLSPQEVLKKVEKVTLSDIAKIASQIFRPEKLNLALIGPFKKRERFLKILNSFK